MPPVLHLVISLAPGGLERLVVDWVIERNRRAPDSTSVCCLDEPGALAGLLPAGTVRRLGARRGRFPFDAAAVWRLRTMLKGQSGVVVHSHNAAALQYAALAACRLPVRHIHTEHGTNPHARSAFNRWRFCRLLRAATVRVAVSAANRDTLCRDFGMRPDEFRVIPNGVAIEAGDKKSAERQAGRGTFSIGCVGRLAEVKGQDRLLTAFAAAFAGQPEIRLQVVGDGPSRPALEAQVARLGIAGQVEFMGFRADARARMRAMDLLALPSRSEGLSVALLEAMAEGVPALATPVGETAAVLEHGACGVLLPDDAAAWPAILRQTVSALRADDSAWRARVARARRRVAESFSLAATCAAYERLYVNAGAGSVVTNFA